MADSSVGVLGLCCFMLVNYEGKFIMAKKQKKSGTKPPDNESKADRFVRVVTPRIVKAVKALELIGNCAGSSYEYTPKQTAQIFSTLCSVLEGVQQRFVSASRDAPKFSFD